MSHRAPTQISAGTLKVGLRSYAVTGLPVSSQMFPVKVFPGLNPRELNRRYKPLGQIVQRIEKRN